MPITYTGRNVKPGNGEHPALLDIAIGLSRQPRFAGQTKRWFSVLDHTLFGLELIKLGENHARGLQLAWLLHDAHEAITADVPTDVKGDDLRGAQDLLDQMIYGAYGQDSAWVWKQNVKDTDRLCLSAEARVLGVGQDRNRFGCGPAVDDAEAVLLGLLRVGLNTIPSGPPIGQPPFGHPDPDRCYPYPREQDQHPAVMYYLRLMEELL
jgi:hypothetical protein